MKLLAIPAKRIGLTLCLCLALIASLVLQPLRAGAASAPTLTRSQVLASLMLTRTNSERAVHHLPGLRMNRLLILSAHRHNLAMARANVMAHQLPHERVFSSRITDAGYNWRTAGENIGWTSTPTWTGLANLQRTMYIEKAPDNGHRLNILSKSFRQVGIDVYLDPTTHKLWFTQDFGLTR